MLQLPLGLEDIAVHGRHVLGVENQANSRMVDPADQFGGAVGRLQEHAGNGHHRLDPERAFASRRSVCILAPVIRPVRQLPRRAPNWEICWWGYSLSLALDLGCSR